MAWVTSTVLAVVAVAAAVAGAGVGAYSAIQAGENAKQAADFNTAVQKNNALAAQQQAAYEAQRVRRRNALVSGAQRAAFSKAGVDISGSVNDVLYDSAVQGEMDAIAALYTGKVRSNSDRAGAMLSTLQGDNAQQSSYYSAAGSILGGVGSGASAGAGYIQRQNNPTFS